MIEKTAMDEHSCTHKSDTTFVSPLDMAGMIGMAQTLAVYHCGYHTLKNRHVQFHGPTLIPGTELQSWTGA